MQELTMLGLGLGLGLGLAVVGTCHNARIDNVRVRVRG